MLLQSFKALRLLHKTQNDNLSFEYHMKNTLEYNGSEL